ncbi:multidrug resistance transporter EmrB [Sulfurospirillum halorespirans DSM 13726]|uniref:Multidrug resistance transporter EmrB n=2 Tax=Sulfurospirillum halorespirans TaxID=194424 RepID=A0A1D7TH95_9BACT|nr:multidrug resistance transporter EmrB [Sulfurospirillum halorespirans DSM 13726]
MMSTHNAEIKPLEGTALMIAAFMLCAANFVAVLNMTIANVAVPNIAGNLGSTMSQGTWVITSYAVGEAITVPLTGWFAARFGAVRVFVIAMIMFGVMSALCGMSNSLGMLVVARVFQGFAGGPLMPLSQTLLIKIFPKEKVGAAIGMWSMTTLVAPVVGPILGGYLCDEYSWNYVFLLNVPIGLICGFFAWKLLKHYTDVISKNPIDRIGLVLLIVWVAAFQIMLDEGKDLDWFASNKIIALATISLISFCIFIIWEWYEEHPIVDLKVFRHRGFWVSILTISLAFAAFFGVNVLTPLWLQNFMGYTATDAGIATCWIGVSALLIAPIVANVAEKMDARKLIFFGIIVMGLVTLWRSITTTEIDFWSIALPLAMMGVGMPFFFIPTTGLALGSVEEREMDSAAGLMNFLRTLSGAFATSLVNSSWSDLITIKHAQLVDISDSDNSFRMMFEQQNTPVDVTNQMIDSLITSQAVMLATNEVMLYLGVAFICAAFAIWLAPKPTRFVEAGKGGH